MLSDRTIDEREGFLESVDEIPEPHEFTARVKLGEDVYEVVLKGHDHDHHGHEGDNNMRAAVVHVMADAAVSVR